MYILGVNSSSHDTSASIIKDGEVLFAVEEERLNREKHTRKFPTNAIQACLEFANITIDEVDAIAVPFIYSKLIQKRYLEYWARTFPISKERMLAEIDTVRELLNVENKIRQETNFPSHKEIYFCRHQVAHMASAYYISGFNSSALFSIDGLGEIESSMVGIAKGNKIKIFEEYSTNWPDSIGGLYTAITDYLGFIPHCDEGKVMGLAPYGKISTYKKVFENIVKLKKEGKFEFNLDYLQFPFKRHSHVSDKFIKICGPAREPKTEITQRHKDIAAGLQYITEKTMLHIAKNLYKATSNKNICLAGGVALNCVANGEILKNTKFKNIFIQPAANDAGSAVGAAIYYYYLKNPKAKRRILNHSYLGPGYTDAEIKKLLVEKKIEHIKSDNATKQIAQYLADGKIVAWFNGRMEFGPRALGNRSILTAPFPAEMKDILNARVKKRESFRPFAPIVLLEDSSSYFDNSHESPYMLLAYGVKKNVRQKIPAIVHVDGTARVQTLEKSQNPELYELISEFKNLTGIPVILNTSFNVMGQPIICTPKQAIDSFLQMDMDYLVLNNKFIVSKKK